MTGYLLTAQQGEYERHFELGPGPLEPDVTAIGLVYAHAVQHGLKDVYLFRADEHRWFARLELP